MSATDNTMTCPSGAVPEPINLDIDSSSVFAVVPRGNYTSDSPDDWMVSCCAPNAVQLASDNSTGTCWQWCDLPPQFTNSTSDSSNQSMDFLGCLTSTARATNSSYMPSAALVSAAAMSRGLEEGTVGLVVVLVMTVSSLFR